MPLQFSVSQHTGREGGMRERDTQRETRRREDGGRQPCRERWRERRKEWATEGGREGGHMERERDKRGEGSRGKGDRRRGRQAGEGRGMMGGWGEGGRLEVQSYNLALHLPANPALLCTTQNNTQIGRAHV